MHQIHPFIQYLVLTVTMIVSVSTTLIAQTELSEGVKELDKAILTGLESVKEKKWDIALREFSKAREMQEKEKLSSYLFQHLVLPDEDRSNQNVSEQEKQITLWRHSMGNGQAIRAFQTYTAALAGRRSEAEKFSDEVYGLQSPVWGLSWRVFNPVIFDLFDKYVEPQQDKGYGAYLYLAGDLLMSSDDERGLGFIEKAQANISDDPKIAAILAGIYIMSDRPADAKKQAELSLKLQPGQASVYIDLANAEWILGNIDNAKRNALEAKKLRPDLPGPNATLVFIAIEQNDLKAAKEYAEKGSDLSEQHRFFETVKAAYEAAVGNKKKARDILKQNWSSQLPSKEMLEKWFFRRKPLQLLTELNLE